MLQRDFPVVAADQVPLQREKKKGSTDKVSSQTSQSVADLLVTNKCDVTQKPGKTEKFSCFLCLKD